MGFTSMDNWVSNVTTSGLIWHSDFMKASGANSLAAGRWYDLAYFNGTPPSVVHGDYSTNGQVLGGDAGWTYSSGAGFYYSPATGLLTKPAQAISQISTMSQATTCLSGTAYSVIATIGTYIGSGNFNVSLGGTIGAGRASSASVRETLVCGQNNGILAVSGVQTCGGTVTNIAVTQPLYFTPYNSSWPLATYTGGNVSPATKHLTNMGCWTNAAAGAPALLMAVDMLGVYSRIDLNSIAVQNLQPLTATLPRYASGVGVRAFLSVSEAPGAGTQNMLMQYTNSAGAMSRTMGAVVSNTASAIAGHITHSGSAAGNFGPFLPLAPGDTGMRSIQNVQFTVVGGAGSGAIGNIVLCRPLAVMPLTSAYVACERDFLNQLPSMPQVYDNACVEFLLFAGATTVAGSQYQGYCDFTWG